jgi:hypothetical protein
MIKLTETRNIYSVIWEEQSYNLIHVFSANEDYVEIYDVKGNMVDDHTWNIIVNYWENIIEQ